MKMCIMDVSGWEGGERGWKSRLPLAEKVTGVCLHPWPVAKGPQVPNPAVRGWNYKSPSHRSSGLSHFLLYKKEPIRVNREMWGFVG